MKTIKTIHNLIFLILFISSMPVKAQLTENRVKDPYKAEFVYQDLETFIKVYKSLTEESDTLEILQKEYLNKGSKGLKEFIKKYNLTAKRLLYAMNRYPDSYSNIEDKLIALRAQEEVSFKDGYARLKELIPSSEFPPTYFLVAARRGIGSGSVEGSLLSIEKDAIEEYTNGNVGTMIHEMVHMQQLRILKEEYFVIFNEKKSLLSKSVREGVAEFFGQLLSDAPTYKEQFLPYLEENEKELWETFKIDANNKSFGDWYGKPEKKGQPNDLGYLIGLKMAESYFNKAIDKHKASEYLISITDYEKFFKECGYDPK